MENLIGLILPIKDTSFEVLLVNHIKKTLEPVRTQNLGSLLMKLSQSNSNLQSPDSFLVCS